MKRLSGVQLVAVLVLLMACFGCGDKKMIERISKMDDATLEKAIVDFPEEGKALTLMKEELARRGGGDKPDADADDATDADDADDDADVDETEDDDADADDTEDDDADADEDPEDSEDEDSE